MHLGDEAIAGIRCITKSRAPILEGKRRSARITQRAQIVTRTCSCLLLVVLAGQYISRIPFPVRCGPLGIWVTVCEMTHHVVCSICSLPPDRSILKMEAQRHRNSTRCSTTGCVRAACPESVKRSSPGIEPRVGCGLTQDHCGAPGGERRPTPLVCRAQGLLQTRRRPQRGYFLFRTSGLLAKV